jgi:hypothetical protein
MKDGCFEVLCCVENEIGMVPLSEINFDGKKFVIAESFTTFNLQVIVHQNAFSCYPCDFVFVCVSVDGEHRIFSKHLHLSNDLCHDKPAALVKFNESYNMCEERSVQLNFGCLEKKECMIVDEEDDLEELPGMRISVKIFPSLQSFQPLAPPNKHQGVKRNLSKSPIAEMTFYCLTWEQFEQLNDDKSDDDEEEYDSTNSI